jgi:DNA phosphorothioation-associated putative methyltransferase
VQALRRDISHLLSLLDHSPSAKRDKDALLLEEHSGLIRPIWAETLRLGRLPDPAELDPDTCEKIADRLGSIREAVRLAQTAFGVDALKEARTSRIDDLKVYFSLNLFSRRKPYRVLPVELQRDVKGFFGSYKNADSAGRELLFSVGDPSTIGKACEQASKSGLGFLDGDHSLQLDASLVDRLPAPLRVYTGCGEVLYGDIDDADLVKFTSNRISLPF